MKGWREVEQAGSIKMQYLIALALFAGLFWVIMVEYVFYVAYFQGGRAMVNVNYFGEGFIEAVAVFPFFMIYYSLLLYKIYTRKWRVVVGVEVNGKREIK